MQYSPELSVADSLQFSALHVHFDKNKDSSPVKQSN